MGGTFAGFSLAPYLEQNGGLPLWAYLLAFVAVLTFGYLGLLAYRARNLR
jgi:hypothetical protein